MESVYFHVFKVLKQDIIIITEPYNTVNFVDVIGCKYALNCMACTRSAKLAVYHMYCTLLDKLSCFL